MPYFDTSTPDFVVSGVFLSLFVAISNFMCIFASHFEREGVVLVGFDVAQWLECQDGTPNVFHCGGLGCVSGPLFFVVLPCSSSIKNPTSSALCGAIKTLRQ